MNAPESVQRYAERMHKVLHYIDNHLAEALDLEKLSEQAHFSSFHFHRLFAALMGERLGDYVRRRRLEVAALRLRSHSQVNILALALSVGFGSAEAFSRAFKERFGSSPTQWRRQQLAKWQAENSKINQIDGNSYQDAYSGLLHNVLQQSLQRMTQMPVNIVQRPAVKIAYLRYVGPYGLPLGEFWRQQVTPWLAQQGLLQADRYGISHDDPSICDPLKCRYDAAVAVAADYQASASVLLAELPAGKYASLAFYGRSDQIGQVWDRFLRDWLPASGYFLDARPCFEYYPANARFDPETGEFECQIMLPVSQVGPVN